MRVMSVAFAIAALACVSTSAAAATIAFGNYAGGLIPSPPDLRSRAVREEIFQLAMAHCSSYDRIADITGVVPGYGNYISFTCRFAPGYDPVKQGKSFWSFFR